MGFKIPFFGKKKKPTNEAVIDLGKLKEIDERNKILKENPLQALNSAPGPAADSNDMSFLGALATAATAASSDSNVTTPIASSSHIDIEKIERLDRRIDRLIERIELMERKIERIERRVDLKY